MLGEFCLICPHTNRVEQSLQGQGQRGRAQLRLSFCSKASGSYFQCWGSRGVHRVLMISHEVQCSLRGRWALIIQSLPRCILSTVPNSGKPSTTVSYSIYSKLIWSWSHCQDLSSLKLFPNRMKIKTNTEKFFFPKACIYHAFSRFPIAVVEIQVLSPASCNDLLEEQIPEPLSSPSFQSDIHLFLVWNW